MKRVLSVALALLLVCSTLVFSFGCEKKDAQTDETDSEQQNQTADAGNVEPEETEPVVTPDGSDFDYFREDGGVTILGYKGTEKRIAIPAEINGKTVLRIKQFQSETVEYLRIPDSVQTLSYEVCNRNKTLKEVKIGNGIEIIPNYAFNECRNLERVVMGNGVKTIGICAFSNCKALKQVTLSTKLQVIKDDAFSYCGSLRKITLPQGLQEIECEAFVGCDLMSVTIPSTVLSVGAFAFSRNEQLASVTIENGAQFVATVDQGRSTGAGPFIGCLALTTITVPASVTRMRANSFMTQSNVGAGSYPTNIRTLRFLGDAPSIDSIPNFVTPQKDIVLYYPVGADGWDDTLLAELYTLMPYTGI